MKTELFLSVAETSRKTWIWAIPLLVIVFTFGGQILALLPAKYLGLISKESIETYPHILYLIIGSFGVVAAICILWIKFFEGSSLATVGLAFEPRAAKYYVRGLGVGLLMAVVVVLVVFVLGGYVQESDLDFSSMDLIPILVLLFAFIVQAGTEELVFRGWMMGRLSARYGLWAGVIGNSVLFTLMHVNTDGIGIMDTATILLFVASTFLFALFLSLLAIRENSIWGACAWHTTWNWSFITCFGLPTTGLELNLAPLAVNLMPNPASPQWLTGGLDGPEESILTPIVLAIGCIWLLWRIQQSSKAG